MSNLENERLINQGRLSLLQKQFEEEERRGDQLLISLRQQLDPMKKFLDYDLDSATITLKDFRASQLRGRKIQDDIEKLRDLLGRD